MKGNRMRQNCCLILWHVVTKDVPSRKKNHSCSLCVCVCVFLRAATSTWSQNMCLHAKEITAALFVCVCVCVFLRAATSTSEPRHRATLFYFLTPSSTLVKQPHFEIQNCFDAPLFWSLCHHSCICWPCDPALLFNNRTWSQNHS